MVVEPVMTRGTKVTKPSIFMKRMSGCNHTVYVTVNASTHMHLPTICQPKARLWAAKPDAVIFIISYRDILHTTNEHLSGACDA